MGYLHAILSAIWLVAGQHPIDPNALSLVCHVSWLHWQDRSLSACKCHKACAAFMTQCSVLGPWAQPHPSAIS